MVAVPIIPRTWRNVTSVTASGNVLRGMAPLPPEEVIKNIDEWREAYPEWVDTPAGRVLAEKREAAVAALAAPNIGALPADQEDSRPASAG